VTPEAIDLNTLSARNFFWRVVEILFEWSCIRTQAEKVCGKEYRLPHFYRCFGHILYLIFLKSCMKADLQYPVVII